MSYAVWVPLLVPFLAAPTARRAAAYLSPRHAVVLLTTAALLPAATSSAALALLAVPGASYLPTVAALGELARPLSLGPPPVTVALALAAGGVLAWRAGLVAVAVRRDRADLRRARAAAGGTAGELAVLRQARPDAYALPGRPGRIVVTTGMLRALEPDERAALFAHERAHLRGRHHRVLVAVELAALCHPALRTLCEPVGYALERAADEAAAAAVGDRRLVARAIARAALAARAASASAPDRPRAALGMNAGPVPRRVAALLDTPLAVPSTRRPAGRLAVAALVICLTVSGATAVDAVEDLHGHVEMAQGQDLTR
ncbi:M48 family metalloprotease [Streptomyces sp. NPDC095613]|uniref:M48 family metalloprotease n=1 Tax=Streptomyces sp. NPDC095613 TaxID=3155540 RepID=UPI003321D110